MVRSALSCGSGGRLGGSTRAAADSASRAWRFYRSVMAGSPSHSRKMLHTGRVRAHRRIVRTSPLVRSEGVFIVLSLLGGGTRPLSHLLRVRKIKDKGG